METIWRCDLVPQYEKYKTEIDLAIQGVIKSGKYTLANEVKQFEESFADYIGLQHGIGVGNATDALILSLKALGLEEGDEVITTPFTAIPTVSAIIASGAKPVFVDVDPETYLINIESIPAVITKKTKAIMPVHLFGNVVDIIKLKAIIGDKIPIIEDASQSHGSTINGKQSGSMGDISVFSFYPTKNLGAIGDGGMVITNNNEYDEKIRLLRMYGMTDYNHIIINGINSRLDELQAAILSVKLKYLDQMNADRNAIAKRYASEISIDILMPQKIETSVFSNYHQYAGRLNGNREDLMNFLSKKGIQTNIYYLLPLHLQKANAFLGYKEGDFPVAEKICNDIIALPMYPELDNQKIDYIIESINKFS